MVDCTCLENRSLSNRTVSSNLTSSALFRKSNCSRSSMDRIQVCGTCDAGSIPAESTNIKILLIEEYFYICAREKANCLAFVRNRIGVANLLRAKRGRFVTELPAEST